MQHLKYKQTLDKLLNSLNMHDIHAAKQDIFRNVEVKVMTDKGGHYHVFILDGGTKVYTELVDHKLLPSLFTLKRALEEF